MTLIEQCRDLAAKNYSRTQAAEALGIERRTFYHLCKQMPDICWPAPNKSNRDRAGQARRAQAMKKPPIHQEEDAMGISHRTIETKVYHFDQLSDEAKEKARDWWRQCESEDPTWATERRESLEAFCKEFPVEVRDWNYDICNYQITKAWTAGPESQEMKGSRLIGLLINEYGPRVLWEPKVYEKGGKKRKSKIIMVERSCPFTGYCMDEDLLEPIRKYLKKPDLDLCYRDLMGQCLGAWGKACVEDVQWINSNDHVDETILANEYEFDEAGGHV